MASSATALSRRKGGTSQTRIIPWKYILIVVLSVSILFLFLYIRAFNDVINSPTNYRMSQNQPSLGGQTLILTTKLGDIKIKLREDLSKISADYIRQIVAAGDCPRCQFYRAEAGGILQGIIKNPSLPVEDNNMVVHVEKGDCPADLKDSKWKDDCHGPIMEHGMVGWAAGKTGPDFFIDWYKKPAKFWGAQHTVWGEVVLDESSNVIDEIWKLPATKNQLTYLVEPLKFTMKVV